MWVQTLEMSLGAFPATCCRYIPMRWAIELATFETKSAVIVKISSSNALLCIWLRKPNDDCTGSFRRDFVAGGTAATSIRALINEPPLAGILEKLNG